ncbi:MAG: sigma-70 family RNA polymerase sigma factor [Tepidisphaeraceae bacterium]
MSQIMKTMAKFRIDTVAALARQMEFTPADTRLAQVAAAEGLLHTLDPAKAYPLEFVVFRVTGYHPKTEVSAGVQELLTGLALQHDLGLLIEKVSDTLDLRSDAVREPVLSIDDVTERFNVTSKTIQRWRRKGLPARRFLFPDGKRRVGFLLSSVERFVTDHREQVERGTNFSQVDDAERDEIVRRARRLAVACRCCEREIARRIAGRFNRSPLTVLHTIRKHDQQHPDVAIFTEAAEEIDADERQQILKGYRRGLALRSLARRSCRPRTAVYRVILDERIERLTQRKVKFFDDPFYHGEDADQVVNEVVSQQELAPPRSVEETRVPRDLPPSLADLYRTPLLTPARERALFLKFNFHKFEFVAARRKLEPQFARARDLNLLESHLRRAAHTKNTIVRANLRLVVSVARKHLRPGLSLAELISDGTITLMRAVEGFDLHRGHRFSTYATFALMKGFARSVPLMLAKRRDVVSAGDVRALGELPDRRSVPVNHRLMHREEVGRLMELLDDRERSVIAAHFGLEGHLPRGAGEEPATLDQIATDLGLTRQRVRQIERSALDKLRAATASGW